jgi:hypothetical protein
MFDTLRSHNVTTKYTHLKLKGVLGPDCLLEETAAHVLFVSAFFIGEIAQQARNIVVAINSLKLLYLKFFSYSSSLSKKL